MAQFSLMGMELPVDDTDMDVVDSIAQGGGSASGINETSGESFVAENSLRALGFCSKSAFSYDAKCVSPERNNKVKTPTISPARNAKVIAIPSDPYDGGVSPLTGVSLFDTFEIEKTPEEEAIDDFIAEGYIEAMEDVPGRLCIKNCGHVFDIDFFARQLKVANKKCPRCGVTINK